jgi:hypothetical protein
MSVYPIRDDCRFAGGETMKRLYTSAEVYAVLFAKHKDELIPVGSFSDPDGTFQGGPGTCGRMETEYGLKDADYPLIGIATTWAIVNGKAAEKCHCQYWLCVVERDD